MDQANNDTRLLQIKAQQFANHVQCRLARMVRVISSALLLVPQDNGAGLGRDEHHLGALGEETCGLKPLDDEDGRNRAGGVHAQFGFPVWTLFGSNILGRKVPSRNYLLQTDFCEQLARILHTGVEYERRSWSQPGGKSGRGGGAKGEETYHHRDWVFATK
jgi:hypothetical protein